MKMHASHLDDFHSTSHSMSAMKNPCSQSCKRKLMVFFGCLMAYEVLWWIAHFKIGLNRQSKEPADHQLSYSNPEFEDAVSIKPTEPYSALIEGDTYEKSIKRFLEFQQRPSAAKKQLEKKAAYFETHAEEADAMEKEFASRRKHMEEECQKQLNISAIQQASFLKLLPETFDNVLMKMQAEMTYSDDDNKILLCSSRGVYAELFAEPLHYFSNLRRIKLARGKKAEEIKKQQLEEDGEVRELKVWKALNQEIPDTEPPPLSIPEGLSSRPLMTYSKAEIYSRTKTYRKVALIVEPYQRMFTDWRSKIESPVKAKSMDFYEVGANFTRYFYIITLKPKIYPNQVEQCSLCYSNYDYLIKMENMDKELEYVEWKLALQSSDLFRKENFIEQPLKALEVPIPKGAFLDPTIKPDPTSKTAYENRFGKLPTSIMNDLYKRVQLDFAVLGYRVPQLKRTALELNDAAFLQWQRGIIVSKRNQMLSAAITTVQP